LIYARERIETFLERETSRTVLQLGGNNPETLFQATIIAAPVITQKGWKPRD